MLWLQYSAPSHFVAAVVHTRSLTVVMKLDCRLVQDFLERLHLSNASHGEPLYAMAQ